MVLLWIARHVTEGEQAERGASVGGILISCAFLYGVC